MWEGQAGMKEGGQALLGGLDCSVSRNFFGAQINSFETQLPAPACLPPEADGSAPDFRAIFIRAPAVLETGPSVEVLSQYVLAPDEAATAGRDSVAVAVRNGPLLATAFHPELTSDLRWHRLFVEGVRQRLSERQQPPQKAGQEAPQLDVDASKGLLPSKQHRDLPVFWERGTA
eukprot:jgi/Botrbrau1/11201/Bobra.0214s0025.1